MTATDAAPKSDLERLPSRLSPSRAKDFLTCPKMFYYKTIERLPTKNSVAATRGSIAHKALEQLFEDYPRDQRTVDKAVSLVKPAWEEMRTRESYQDLVKPGSRSEANLVADAEGFVRNYFTIEDPTKFDPVAVEYHVEETVGGTVLHGYIDRLDRVPDPSSDGQRTYVSDYKGLAVTTPLPTPAGWTTMGAVEVGDELLGANGYPVEVVAKSQVHDRPCFKVSFDDGTAVVCDNVHLWTITVQDELWRPTTKVVGAEELCRLAQDGAVRRLYIRNGQALQQPVADLPIDPWVLGYFLGSSPGSPDEAHVAGDVLGLVLELLAVRWPGKIQVRRQHETARVALSGPAGTTRPSHVVESGIPEQYLRASDQQRIQLLQGLMDAAGTWDASTKQVVFRTSSPQLASQLRELVQTLGENSRGWVVGEAEGAHEHRVSFCSSWLTPFLLSPRAESMDASRPWESFRAAGVKTITSVERVESVPTQCVKVDAEDSLYLCGVGMVPTHNTGKIPKPRYMDDAFFAMRIYALLLFEETGQMPFALRLVYLKEPGVQSIKTVLVDQQMIDRARKDVTNIWLKVRAAAARGEWPTKKGPLCNWCDFKSICPAWQ